MASERDELLRALESLVSSGPKPKVTKLDRKVIFEALKSFDSKPRITRPDDSVDKHIQNIYEQAYQFRDKLIKFYIWYTGILSMTVAALIFLQAQARLIDGSENLELIPEWAFSLIVAGMFGQFIGLLTIVTKRVWEYKEFLNFASKSAKEGSKRL